ncbi:MAG: response regulator [Bacteroidales bacterium]
MNIKNSKILVVDDDQHSLIVLNHILSQKKHEVKTCISGEEALQAVHDFLPDLILLDIIMPGTDGYEVLDALKREPLLSEIPVIFITAAGDTSEMVKGLEKGAVDFISKPVNKPELLARVKTHIDLKQSRDIISQSNFELMQEIENRKQAEEKFRALSETAFEAIIFLENNKIIECNKAAKQLLNLPDHTEMVELTTLVDRTDHQLLQQAFKRKISNQAEIRFYPRHSKSGFWGLVQQQMIHYMGKSVHVLAISDITRQKEIDKEIYNAVLQAQEKERKRFSRDIHDGLGAVLSTLNIYTGLLQKPNKTAEEKDNILQEMKKIIAQAVESARTIANDIMPGMLMDHGLVKALKSFVDGLNKTGTIRIVFLADEAISSMENSKETHLYRIAMELLNNSIKHGNASEAKLSLKRHNESLVLEYTDNGMSFDFNKIYKQKNNSNGLMNILSRVNLMNGKGYYDNIPGKKLRFYMEIPF